MMDIETWITSEETIKRSRRTYSHFDSPTDFSKCWEYILKPDNIATHGFYPFIRYTKKIIKFPKNGNREPKKRDICYAAHIDRCIFQYYNYLLSNRYNQECDQLGISDVAVAYRNNMKGKSNIQFAKKAIDFIRSCKNCYVMIGDFTKFFDNLDHRYLKERWKELLHETTLPDDHYAVFKNITQFSTMDMKQILRVLNLTDDKKGRTALNKMRRIFLPSEIKNYRTLIHKNKNVGIPQGSPMSGALANIYMLAADKEINDYVVGKNGLYMRYSDDFIIVLPHQEGENTKSHLQVLQAIFNNDQFPGLELQMSKTQYYYFDQNSLYNCGATIDICADTSNRNMNFLGFTFDGKKVTIRAKTISKYYYRMRKKAKTIAKSRFYTKKGKHISGKNIYMKYSERGASGKKGNFLTYVNRCKSDKAFGSSELIDRDTKRNMAKIRKAMKKKY